MDIALTVLTADRKYANDACWRQFRRQLFHSSIQAILETLRTSMTVPRVTKCPDGHF